MKSKIIRTLSINLYKFKPVLTQRRWYEDEKRRARGSHNKIWDCTTRK